NQKLHNRTDNSIAAELQLIQVNLDVMAAALDVKNAKVVKARADRLVVLANAGGLTVVVESRDNLPVGIFCVGCIAHGPAMDLPIGLDSWAGVFKHSVPLR